MPATVARTRTRSLPAPRRPARPPGSLVRHVLAVAVDVDDCARVLLLAEHAGGGLRVRRARCWPPDAPTGPLVAALGALYRAGADQTPTAVHVAPGGRGPWLDTVRRAVGPLAELTVHTAPAADWTAAAALAMAVLDADPAEDPEHLAVLAERAIRRAGGRE
ncbi:hypothetical protein [Streptomyces sp. Isolate_45]|uniref:hypothetical protein n=1 Tax=Streptomyces sp. Isolate_45 TaxID=2950111 RepID=UPI002481A684|nr:hypothetical protein [Streptomyces sp. Isolate_45]MDA5283703.1 hypothetical protein [Streptomyces sp. Isolate_45]